MRSSPEADPERVLVLQTLGAPRRTRRRLGRRTPALHQAGPEPVPTSRATLVGARPCEDAAHAESWLAELRRSSAKLEEEVAGALRALNGLLRAHRAAVRDPYVRDVAADQALVTRVGFGAGDQVADGRFAQAFEVPGGPGRRRRAEVLSPQERLAAIVGGREAVMPSEELTLRARMDVDAGRPREAALQCRIALEALLSEAREEPAADAESLAALQGARSEVTKAANAALAGDPGEEQQRAVEETVRRMESVLRRRLARR